ncbi:MAG: FAD-binding oxidoreductase [Pseudomonadota bacterium]
MSEPAGQIYDVVIIGGAIMGSATAWFLSKCPDFDGKILVIDRDLTFGQTSTAHTTSCIRQQFSSELNIKISQYAAQFIKSLCEQMDNDGQVRNLTINNFGYLYLAENKHAAQRLQKACEIQHLAGTPTELLQPDAIAQRYPFFALDDIVLGSLNTVDEGYFDSWALFDAFRAQARRNGVEYIENEVVAVQSTAIKDRVSSVTLASGTTVACGRLVNASGPRAAKTAALAGVNIPVEPRKRFSWVFRAEKPLGQPLPLTIDPSGIHVRENGGGTYQAGGHTLDDPVVDVDDFDMDHLLWNSHVWPILAARIPQFEAVKVIAEWAGHYAFNTFDQNAIIGPHPELTNFLFLNGFSGHGLQQAPAMGRGLAEWITYGQYRSMDLSAFHYDRIVEDRAYQELAII